MQVNGTQAMAYGDGNSAYRTIALRKLASRQTTWIQAIGVGKVQQHSGPREKPVDVEIAKLSQLSDKRVVRESQPKSGDFSV